MKVSQIFAILFSACFLLIAAGCIQGQPGTPVPTPATTAPSPSAPGTTVPPAVPASLSSKDELVSFVRDAVAYAKTNGKEAALAEFDKRNGSFFRGELYIYAYDFNGTTIAHPVNPEKIGVSRINETDAEGNYFIRELRDTAKNGGGFVEYYYINPLNNNTIARKLGYVEKVDDSWWLGSGIYYGQAGPDARPAGTSPAGKTVPETTRPA